MIHDVCITIDVDWAPDFALEEMAALLREHDVPATWFVTHESPFLELLRERPDLFEVGAHPNFLPGSTHGSSDEEVLDHVTRLAPEAVSFRSHSLVQSGPLLALARHRTRLRIDSNIFAAGMPGLRPFAHATPYGLIHRVPFMWADDYWLLRSSRESSMETVLGGQGLKVLLFHPLHYILNSSSLEDHQAVQAQLAREGLASSTVNHFVSSKHGVGDLFAECVTMLSHSSRAARLRDFVDTETECSDRATGEPASARDASVADMRIPHSRTVLADEDVEAATAVLRSGQVAEADATRELERTAAAYLSRRHAWATSGGTAALHSALLCMGIGRGDDVLVPTYTCDDVLSAVLQVGATPVPVDLDPAELNPDPQDAAAKAGPRARAVVLAHVLGMPARVAEVQATGVPVIEDCAHGLGGSLAGVPAGSHGECTVMSFHGLKMVTAGEGGMVLTDDDEIAAGYRRLRYPDFAAGQHRMHSRMSSVLAAIATQQFGRLDEIVAHRRRLAERYANALVDLAHAVPVPITASDGRRSSGYRFALMTDGAPSFDEAARQFLDNGVIVRRPVKQLTHRTLGLPAETCPQAERVFDRIVSLPMYPSLTEAEQDRVIEAASKVLG